MKIVNVIGGLGNQMFQFAFYLALKRRFPTETVKIYTGAYRGYDLHNAYELDRVFGLEAPQATAGEVGRLAYPYLNYRLWQIGNHLLPARRTMLKERVFGRYYAEAFERQGDCYYDGYWQSDRYFADMRLDLLMAYTPIDIDERNLSVGRKLFAANSVSIHVRRGDFQQKAIYQGICGLDYYRQAIAAIEETTGADTFCIFSNDQPWCREHLLPLLQGKHTVVADWNGGRQSYLDMYLMSQCRHNVLAHSSFSWWGAWLNQHPDKTVIGPQRWNNIKTSEFTLPDSWMTL